MEKGREKKAAGKGIGVEGIERGGVLWWECVYIYHSGGIDSFELSSLAVARLGLAYPRARSGDLLISTRTNSSMHMRYLHGQGAHRRSYPRTRGCVCA